MGYRFFIIGTLLVLIGVQLRVVDSFVLTPKATEFVEHRIRNSGLQKPAIARSTTYDYDSLLLSSGPRTSRRIQPPRWMGWAALSAGGVLMFHGLTLRKMR